MRFASPVALLLLLLLHPGSLPAQSGWVFDLSAGHVSYRSIGARIASTSAVAGVRQDAGGFGWAYLYGGVPLQTQGVTWGAGGVGRRVGVANGPITVGADVGAHLLGYRADQSATPGSAVTLELLPVLGVRHGGVGAEIRSGILQHTDWVADARLTRRIHDSGVRVGTRLHPAIGVRADLRYVRAPEGDYPYAGGMMEARRGTATMWASAGRWASDTLATAEYGAGLGWRPGDLWAFRAGWQQETSDPLFWSPPRRGWSVQVSRQLGRRPAPIASAIRDAEGRITIRLPVAEIPSPPSVLGEFTGWLPVPMVREGDFWIARLTVQPGVYRYGFHDAAGQWFLPAVVTHRVDDGMGGESAVLIVP